MTQFQKYFPEALRSLAFGSISGTYANIGAVETNPWVEYIIHNTTDTDITVSLDGGTTDHLRLKSGAVFQLRPGACSIAGKSNIRSQAGIQFAAKLSTATVATLGAICVSGFFLK